MKKYNIYAFADEASPKIDEQIVAMKKNGLDGLEIRTVDGIGISDIDIGKAKEVKLKLDDAGLIAWSLGSPIGKIAINDDFDAHLEKLKHTLEIGNILGTSNIRIFSFYPPENSNFDDYTDSVIDKVGKMADICVSFGIMPCHENEKDIFGDMANRCLKLYEQLPLLHGIFDPANFIQSGQETNTAWKMLKPYIKYLHIKDALKDGTVVPAGDGEGHLQDIVSDYINFGGKDFTIEPHLFEFIGFNDLEKDNKTIMKSYSYSNSEEAFDIACSTFKKLLQK